MNGIMKLLETINKFVFSIFFLFASLAFSNDGHGDFFVNNSMAEAIASQASYSCKDKKSELPINNDQILQWLRTSRNQFKARGHVSGVVEKIYSDQSNHQHFSVRFGNDPDAKIEVIYNIEFGRIVGLNIGSEIEACGDYITATAQAGGYPPSPDGAVLHWVHQSNSSRHEDGFVVVDGVLFGRLKSNQELLLID